MILRNLFRSLSVLAVLFVLFTTTKLRAQAPTGSLHGQIADPSGAVIPNATVTVTTAAGKAAGTGTSGSNGAYTVRGLSGGSYNVDIAAQGFAPFHASHITVAPGQSRNFDAALNIAVEQQQVQVNAEAEHVDTSPEDNANAIVIKGKDLDALSDDPDELENELQALAGPAAGPNGGQIYIDGFTGGQLPPKSAIREIRINQNPFSAEYDRLGYGRIEILTKPGSEKVHGEVHGRGNYSAFNAQNPILNANLQPGQTASLQEPSYYSYDVNGSLGGPLSKHSSYFVDVFGRQTQNQSIVDALNPDNVAATLNEAVSNPSSRFDFSPRFDFQLGQANTLTVRYEFYRAVTTNGGVGEFTLPSQAYNSRALENTLQLSDSVVMSQHLVDDIRFQYRRIRNSQMAQNSAPSISVQSAFNTGGNSSQVTDDHQDDYELQNYFSGNIGAHSLSFGTRLRAYRDANFTNGGSNGSYTFTSTSQYVDGTPSQYSYTKINNPTARAILFDAALFYQDDWKVNNRFTFSYGLRWESQNRIHDKDDWAPRFSLAYALDGEGKKPAKTVLRAGYGWFYNRFTVPSSFGSNSGTPYVIQTIHENLVNEQQYIEDNPGFYNPNTVTPINSSNVSPSGPSAPTLYTIDPHFKAANDMEGAIGVDRQLAKNITSNVTYLYTQGDHQYLTNNIGAIANQNVNPTTGTYTGPVVEPSINELQYQSEGIYKEHQIIATVHANYRAFSLFSFYSYSDAKADTSGVTYVPTVASNPGLDYGRAGFDVHDRFLMLSTIQAPWKLTFAPIFYASSGTPFNITTGSDLTGNNQFNARPTFAASCSEANTVQTPYGCLDASPVGTNAAQSGTSERIIPYNIGTGPVNYGLNMRVSKVIGFGPKIQGGGGGPHGGPRGGGLGGRGLSGNSGGPGRFDAVVPRKYTLTLDVFGTNLLNHENLVPPNGTIGLRTENTTQGISCTGDPYSTASTTGSSECASSLFLKSQNLSGGFFSPPTAGNRSIFLEARFAF